MSETRSDPMDVGPILNPETLRRMMARHAIQAGQIPSFNADSMSAMSGGDGASCAICILPITPQEPGYRLEFAQEGRGSVAHYLHVPCFAAWEFECQKPNDEAPPGNGRQNGRTPGPER